MQNEPLLQKGRHIGARLETEDTAVPECWQGDQGTTKVGKHISRVVLTVRATGFIQCGRGMLRQHLPEHATPTLDSGCVKPVSETFERALDMRFPTFVVP